MFLVLNFRNRNKSTGRLATGQNSPPQALLQFSRQAPGRAPAAMEFKAFGRAGRRRGAHDLKT